MAKRKATADLSKVSIIPQELRPNDQLTAGGANGPICIHTMIVRTPGRVIRAQEYVAEMAKVAALDSGRPATTVTDDLLFTPALRTQYEKTLLASMRVLELYMGGVITDEMVLEVELPPLADPDQRTIRMLGTVDPSGRVEARASMPLPGDDT